MGSGWGPVAQGLADGVPFDRCLTKRVEFAPGVRRGSIPTLRVLSLSTVFPRPAEPAHGVFVARRLEALTKLAEVRVINPVPVMEYGNAGQWFQWQGPSRTMLGNLMVYRPKWAYPPLVSTINPVFLAAQLKPLVRKIAETYPFSLIDAHFGHPEGIAAAILARSVGCPFVVTLRGNETMHAHNSLTRRMLAKTFQAAARVITVSERLREFAISLGADPDRVKTIPNGVDVETFLPMERTCARERHGIAAGEKIVLSVGALIERKGHHRTMQAVETAVRAGLECRLVIAGGAGREGDYRAFLREEVSKRGMESRVQFTGPVAPAELAEWMSAADVLSLASTREGWPNVVHEALACGCPVVATDVGGVPDMIPNDQTGIVVPVGDQTALDAALQQALSCSWDRLAISVRARERSWARVATEVADVMHGSLEESRMTEGVLCAS
jgi:teichuronic acid biosynthesis glycosyltransferase TuaC